MADPSHTTKCRTNTKHPTYRGIRCKSGKWVSEIREPRKTTRIWLGTYPTPHMAAAAYDVAALAIKGTHNVLLNFPHHLHSYQSLPPSPSPADIRRAAATAAAAMSYYDDRPSGSMGGEATCSEGGSSENIRRAAATAAAMSSPEGDYDDRPSGSRSGVTCNEGGSSENCAMQIGNMEITKGEEGYVDEEELFDFPSLLVNMAEAMMLSPPRINSSSSLEDHSHGDSDVESLWSY